MFIKRFLTKFKKVFGVWYVHDGDNIFGQCTFSLNGKWYFKHTKLVYCPYLQICMIINDINYFVYMAIYWIWKLENNFINNVTHGAYNQQDQTWCLFMMDQTQNK